MSVDIPREVVEAAEVAFSAHAQDWRAVWHGALVDALTAAYPIIERQIRAKIAKEIETLAWGPSPDAPVSRKLAEAARIARGGQDG